MPAPSATGGAWDRLGGCGSRWGMACAFTLGWGRPMRRSPTPAASAVGAGAGWEPEPVPSAWEPTRKRFSGRGF
eukprot:10734398-Lingulodinium_polyedra.AAC.1